MDPACPLCGKPGQLGPGRMYRDPFREEWQVVILHADRRDHIIKGDDAKALMSGIQPRQT